MHKMLGRKHLLNAGGNWLLAAVPPQWRISQKLRHTG